MEIETNPIPNHHMRNQEEKETALETSHTLL